MLQLSQVRRTSVNYTTLNGAVVTPKRVFGRFFGVEIKEAGKRLRVEHFQNIRKMDEAKIYIKGKPGFKPAVKTKLGGTWIHGDSDVSVDTIMFYLSADSDLNAFKASIGKELISFYDLQFFTSLQEPDQPESPKQPLTMSIWTDRDSRIAVRESQKAQHDPGVPMVF